MNIQLLKFRRRRPATKVRSNKIRDSRETQTLAGGKYCGPTRPLLSVSVGFATFILFTSIAYEQELSAPDLSTPKKTVQAFQRALTRNDTRLVRWLALATEEQLAVAKVQHDLQQAFYRLEVARTKKVRVESSADVFDASVGDERKEGEENATVGGDGAASLFKLEKGLFGRPPWKIDFRTIKVPSAETIAATLRFIKDLDAVRTKVEAGKYENDREVDQYFKVEGTVLAAMTGASEPASSKSRSDDSLAVERFLRSELIGGLSEQQVIELSDLIAEKFDAAGLSAEARGYCTSRRGDKKIFLSELDQIARGEQSPASDKVAASGLILQITHMLPARAVFNGLLGPGRTTDRALPALEESITRGYRTAGTLASEHLVSFEEAIYGIAGRKPNATEYPLGYWNKVKYLNADNVLYCSYQGQYEPGDVSLQQAGLLDDPTYIEGLDKNHHLRSSENVFAFSLGTATREILQLLRMCISHPGHAYLGAETEHFVSGGIDRNTSGCESDCPFPKMLAKGDRTGFTTITGYDRAAHPTPQQRPQNPIQLILAGVFVAGRLLSDLFAKRRQRL